MAVRCEKCGARVASRAALAGHFRRAHSRGRKARRSVALVPAKRASERPEPIRAEVLDVTPVQSEIVPLSRALTPPIPVSAETRIIPKPKPRLAVSHFGGDGPPVWWFPREVDRRERWARLSPECRVLILRDHEPRLRESNLPGGALVRAGVAFTIRPPEATDATILFSQYHALKALATRLDAGIGTEREREAFEAGLREYNQNFDRIAQRKRLVG